MGGRAADTFWQNGRKDMAKPTGAVRGFNKPPGEKCTYLQLMCLQVSG